MGEEGSRVVVGNEDEENREVCRGGGRGKGESSVKFWRPLTYVSIVLASTVSCRFFQFLTGLSRIGQHCTAFRQSGSILYCIFKFKFAFKYVCPHNLSLALSKYGQVSFRLEGGHSFLSTDAVQNTIIINIKSG